STKPSGERHLSSIAGQRRERANKTLLSKIAYNLAIAEETLADPLHLIAMARAKLSKGGRSSAKDFGYQFLVGVNGAAPMAYSGESTHIYT
ncbi:MAG: hypothetical protein ABSG46_15190, partial [Candidatus Binataceae bacterium]